MLSVDTRYDAYLADMVSLLQEALHRSLTNKPLDLHKFTQYFTTFHSHLARLEGQMHPDKTKFTKCLAKLKGLCAQGQPSAATHKTTEVASNHHKTVTVSSVDQSIQQPAIRVRTSSKQGRELGSIQEEEESPSRPVVARKRRSETAGGQRREYSTVDWERSRPMTGHNQRERYYQQSEHQITEGTASALEAQVNEGPIEPGRREKRGGWMSFYDDLEREKEEVFVGRNLGLPYRKKHADSGRKWSQKIGRLL